MVSRYIPMQAQSKRFRYPDKDGIHIKISEDPADLMQNERNQGNRLKMLPQSKSYIQIAYSKINLIISWLNTAHVIILEAGGFTRRGDFGRLCINDSPTYMSPCTDTCGVFGEPGRSTRFRCFERKSELQRLVGLAKVICSAPATAVGNRSPSESCLRSTRIVHE